MLCSPAEIEKKRQEALKKLARRNSSPEKSDPIQCNSPLKMFHLGNTPKFKNKPYQRATSASKSSNSCSANPVTSQQVIVSMHLVSEEKFCASTSTFSSIVIETFKTISSKSYEPKTRQWTFQVKDYDVLLSRLQSLKDIIIIEPLPKFALKCVKETQSFSEVDTSQMDPTLLQTLLPFQLEGLYFGVRNKGRCLIADDMGLGKTFQALAIMNYYKNDWPLLIVTTASMKNVWEETIMKNIPSISIMQIQYMVSTKDFIGDSLILIVSHDLMSRCCDKLLQRQFGAIIIDESHNLKNYKAKMTQSAIKLCKTAARVVLLSGTPAMSRPKELYTQLSLIDDRFFFSFFEYAKRYCGMQQTVFGLNTLGESNLQELEIILKRKFMIRRTKEQVLGSLPSKTQEILKLDIMLKNLDKKDRDVLDALTHQFTNARQQHTKQKTLLALFGETAKLKLKAVCAHIDTLLKLRIKIIVFAHHLVMLDGIEKIIKKADLKYMRIDGNTSSDQRKYFIDQFQTNPEVVCALLSITSANAGITLTAAQRVVFAELHWNPSILNQAEARVHRIGQQNEVLIQYLLADGTADDYIWPMLEKKESILQKMGLTTEAFSSVSEKSCEDLVMSDDDSVFDDGLDEVLCNIDV